MNNSALVRPTSVRFDEFAFWVDLDDGRTLGVPLAWFSRLLHGSAADRALVEISPTDLHWDRLDEDISIAGLLAGQRNMTRPRANAF